MFKFGDAVAPDGKERWLHFALEAVHLAIANVEARRHIPGIGVRVEAS